MASREFLLTRLREYLHTLFDIPLEKITVDARLNEDLDIDSIDAVELVVKLQEITGRKIKPEAFKTVRTVGDILDCMEELVTE